MDVGYCHYCNFARWQGTVQWSSERGLPFPAPPVKPGLRFNASSSAVAKRPCDASCLSVVSFSIVHNVEQSLLLLVT